MIVADDKEFCINSMMIMLKKAQLDVEKQVDIVIDGLGSIQKVEHTYSNGQSYSLILTDFSMPKMDGLDST